MVWSEGDHWRCSVKIHENFEGLIEYKYIVTD